MCMRAALPLAVNSITPEWSATLDDETELLFAPYSVFTVISVKWSDNCSGASLPPSPHQIELEVYEDNLKAPARLPLSPWN